MDAFKGVFRRATQSAKERLGNAESTDDALLNEAAKRVRNYERAGVTLSEKITKLSKSMEESMLYLREFAEAFKAVSEGDMSNLADELLMVSNEGAAKVVELQKGLRDCFDNIGVFLREVPKLKEAEEDRRKKQLEFDFFKTKVTELKKDPPKDYTRIPRNEQILENWRVELWKSTENCKAVVSNLYSGGQRSLDISAYSVAMTVSNLWSAQLNSAKLHFVNARLPVYPTAPLLSPAPLPPNPFPPWVPPMYQPQGAAPGQQLPPGAGVPPGGFAPSGPQSWPPQQPQPGQQPWPPQQGAPPGQQQPWPQQQQPQYAQHPYAGQPGAAGYPPQQHGGYAPPPGGHPQHPQQFGSPQQQPGGPYSAGASPQQGGYTTPQQGGAAAASPQQPPWQQTTPQQQQQYAPGLNPQQVAPANPYTSPGGYGGGPHDGSVAPASSFAGASSVAHPPPPAASSSHASSTAFDAAVPPPPPS